MTYVGFDWDLHTCAMALPEHKHIKYPTRVSDFLSAGRVSLDKTMKIQGTLQHLTFIFMAGSSYLPLLSWVVKAFKGNRHRRHHVTQDVQADLSWCQAVLLRQGIYHSLLPHLHLEPSIWVDASMSWGIGLVVKCCWATWMILEGWKAKDHDIGWADSHYGAGTALGHCSRFP